MSESLAIGVLLLWGAFVSLDERGLFATAFASPFVAALGAGLLTQDVTSGVAFGLLFHSLFPVRVESGGQVPPSAGLAGVGAVAFLWAAGARLDAVILPGETHAAAGALSDRNRLATLVAPSPVIPLLAFGLGLGIAEAGRRWERALRKRNGVRETAAVTQYDDTASVESARGPRNRDPLRALRRAQVLAASESAARGAVSVAAAIALGWSLRSTALFDHRSAPVSHAWHGMLLVAPLLGAAFLLRDLPAPLRAGAASARPIPRNWSAWIVALLGCGAGALAVGCFG